LRYLEIAVNGSIDLSETRAAQHVAAKCSLPNESGWSSRKCTRIEAAATRHGRVHNVIRLVCNHVDTAHKYRPDYMLRCNVHGPRCVVAEDRIHAPAAENGVANRAAEVRSRYLVDRSRCEVVPHIEGRMSIVLRLRKIRPMGDELG